MINYEWDVGLCLIVTEEWSICQCLMGREEQHREYCQHWIKGDNRLPRESKDISELSRFLRFPVRKASICHIYTSVNQNAGKAMEMKLNILWCKLGIYTTAIHLKLKMCLLLSWYMYYKIELKIEKQKKPYKPFLWNLMARYHIVEWE